MVDVLVISISNPLKIGVYKDEVLLKTYEIDGKTSDELPKLFKTILKSYKINHLLYVNCPGSYMAIKVTYVFLKSISIVNDTKFLACNGFHFNENSPIKALGKKYFINKNNTIEIDFISEDKVIKPFLLPENLDISIFSEETLPVYNLPAV